MPREGYVLLDTLVLGCTASTKEPQGLVVLSGCRATVMGNKSRRACNGTGKEAGEDSASSPASTLRSYMISVKDFLASSEVVPRPGDFIWPSILDFTVEDLQGFLYERTQWGWPLPDRIIVTQDQFNLLSDDRESDRRFMRDSSLITELAYVFSNKVIKIVRRNY